MDVAPPPLDLARLRLDSGGAGSDADAGSSGEPVSGSAGSADGFLSKSLNNEREI